MHDREEDDVPGGCVAGAVVLDVVEGCVVGGTTVAAGSVVAVGLVDVDGLLDRVGSPIGRGAVVVGDDVVEATVGLGAVVVGDDVVEATVGLGAASRLWNAARDTTGVPFDRMALAVTTWRPALSFEVSNSLAVPSSAVPAKSNGQ